MTAAGQLRLLYNPCGRDYRAATEIRITAKDGSTLWHLRSLQVDAGLPEYVAGIVPDGFEEVVPVTSMPRGPVRIVISDTTKSSVAEEVTIERLRMDQVYVPRDGFMRESEFTSLDTCPAGGLLR